MFVLELGAELAVILDVDLVGDGHALAVLGLRVEKRLGREPTLECDELSGTTSRAGEIARYGVPHSIAES